MTPPKLETTPERGVRGWRRWRDDDCSKGKQKPPEYKIEPHRQGGTVMKSDPEAHVYLETGDVVLGATRHLGATFRGGKPHRHGSSPDTGERLHIRMPAARPSGKDNGKRKARRVVRGRRHARRDYRDDPHSG